MILFSYHNVFIIWVAYFAPFSDYKKSRTDVDVSFRKKINFRMSGQKLKNRFTKKSCLSYYVDFTVCSPEMFMMCSDSLTLIDITMVLQLEYSLATYLESSHSELIFDSLICFYMHAVTSIYFCIARYIITYVSLWSSNILTGCWSSSHPDFLSLAMIYLLEVWDSHNLAVLLTCAESRIKFWSLSSVGLLIHILLL